MSAHILRALPVGVLETVQHGASNEPGETAADEPAEQQHGQVPEYIKGAKNEGCHCQLADVVTYGADHAQEPQPFQRQVLIEQRTDDIAKQAAAETEQECHHLPGKNAAEDDAHQKHHQGVAAAEPVERHQGDDVGQSHFHAGNGDQRRNLCFNDKDDKGDRCQQGQPCQPLCGGKMGHDRPPHCPATASRLSASAFFSLKRMLR